MESDYQYIFEKYKTKASRTTCPSCGKKDVFIPYIDIETGERLPAEYGLCNRESKCGYSLNPYKTGYHKEQWKKNQRYKPQIRPRPPRPTPPRQNIPASILGKLCGNSRSLNTFLNSLKNTVPFPLPMAEVERVADLYKVGTITQGKYQGGCAFPYINKDNDLRFVEVKTFDCSNHTTDQNNIVSMLEYVNNQRNTPQPEWIIKYRNQELRKDCFFGEHLLNQYPSNPIAVVEAAKTAIYATLYYGHPEDNTEHYIWIATGSLSALTISRAKALAGREIKLFPDLSKKDPKGLTAFEKWTERGTKLAEQLPTATITISDLIETIGTDEDKTNGNDLADFIIKEDWRIIRDEAEPVPTDEPEKEPIKNRNTVALVEAYPIENPETETDGFIIDMIDMAKTLDELKMKLNDEERTRYSWMILEKCMILAKYATTTAMAEDVREYAETFPQCMEFLKASKLG